MTIVVDDPILMKPRSLPNFHMDLANGEFADGTSFRIALSVSGDAIYIFTKRPHPKDKNHNANYVLPTRCFFESLCQAVEHKEQGPK